MPQCQVCKEQYNSEASARYCGASRVDKNPYVVGEPIKVRVFGNPLLKEECRDQWLNGVIKRIYLEGATHKWCYVVQVFTQRKEEEYLVKVTDFNRIKPPTKPPRTN